MIKIKIFSKVLNCEIEEEFSSEAQLERFLENLTMQEDEYERLRTQGGWPFQEVKDE